jgi:aminocarboxymuconate-semialdehyde decarboxylase
LAAALLLSGNRRLRWRVGFVYYFVSQAASRLQPERNVTVIDLHTHLFPLSARDAAKAGRPWYGSRTELRDDGIPVLVTNGKRWRVGARDHLQTTAERLASMDRLGVDIQVLSLLPPILGYDLALDEATGRARAVNDELEAWVRDGNGRFLALGTVPAGHPDAAIAELERFMSLPGFVGVEVGSHVRSLTWDEPALFPILEAADRLDALVFIHPADVRAGTLFPRYYTSNGIGNPLETTTAAAALVFGGVFDRLSRLRVALAHGGGYFALGFGRLDHVRRVRPEAANTSSQVPSDYLRRFFVDSLTHNDRAVGFLVDVMGADHVVLGSDYPADMRPEDPAGDVRANPYLTESERVAILGGNLIRELRLSP